MLCMKIGKNKNHSGKASSQHHLTETTFPFPPNHLRSLCHPRLIVRKCIKGSLRESYWSWLVLLPRDLLVLLCWQRPLASPQLHPSQPRLTRASLFLPYFIFCGKWTSFKLPFSYQFELHAAQLLLTCVHDPSQTWPRFFTLQTWQRNLKPCKMKSTAIAQRFEYHSQSDHMGLQPFSPFLSPQCLLFSPIHLICCGCFYALISSRQAHPSMCSAKCFFRQ